MPPIGERDRRITIRRDIGTEVDAFNVRIEAWSDLATVRAKRTDASASESYRAQEVGAQITARFVIRRTSKVADLTAKDRIAFKGREYNITRVAEPAGTRNRWLEIDAVARAEVTS